ncbi:MAG: hypothetical protein QME12_05880 [Nanoarchaeota archaeon]|nr:hypothetical protein [Nanoarchaeota archaeon]
MKMEDEAEFLKRMRQMVLAKGGEAFVDKCFYEMHHVLQKTQGKS